MGACFGKVKPKRNAVCPTAENGNNRNKTVKQPEDMMRDLEEAHAEDSKLANGGVAFTVDFTDGDPARMPSRLADRLNGAVTPVDSNKEVIYTSEEKELLAELLRNDILREKKEKAAEMHSGAKS